MKTNHNRTLVLNDQGGGIMNVTYDVTNTLRANTKHHEPIVLVYDARGNGGGAIVPTLTGDHQNRVTDYTALIVEDRMSEKEYDRLGQRTLQEGGQDESHRKS